MATERHEVAFLVGALVGSVAGAVYGLLNAPQAGWRTRADLTGYLEALGDRAAGRISGAVMELQALRERGFETDASEPWPAAVTADVRLTATPDQLVIERTVNQAGSEGVTGQ